MASFATKSKVSIVGAGLLFDSKIVVAFRDASAVADVAFLPSKVGVLVYVAAAVSHKKESEE